MTNLGSTVCIDGTLKDTSEMEWHYDKDDGTPMLVELSSAPVRSFLAPKATAMVVDGTCRSGWSSCPSTHLVNSNNAINNHTLLAPTNNVLAWLGLKAMALAWLSTACGLSNCKPRPRTSASAWLGLALAQAMACKHNFLKLV